MSFDRVMQAKADLREADAAGQVADSREVRLALMARVDSGELTLQQAQDELRRIKRGAKAAGKVTRDQAFKGATP